MPFMYEGHSPLSAMREGRLLQLQLQFAGITTQALLARRLSPSFHVMRFRYYTLFDISIVHNTLETICKQHDPCFRQQKLLCAKSD